MALLGWRKRVCVVRILGNAAFVAEQGASLRHGFIRPPPRSASVAYFCLTALLPLNSDATPAMAQNTAEI